MLNDAVKWREISRDAADIGEAPKVPQKDVVTFVGDELDVFLDGLQQMKSTRSDMATILPMYEAMFVLGVTTGLRPAELYGLCWDDLDLTTGEVRVRRTLNYGRETQDQPKGFYWGEPKTEKSARVVALTDEATAALRRLKDLQGFGRVLEPTVWQREGLVFVSRRGVPMLGTTVAGRSKRVCAELGTKSITPYAMRHAFGTWMLDVTNIKAVSVVLGHTTTKMTERYLHPDGTRVALDGAAAFNQRRVAR